MSLVERWQGLIAEPLQFVRGPSQVVFQQPQPHEARQPRLRRVLADGDGGLDRRHRDAVVAQASSRAVNPRPLRSACSRLTCTSTPAACSAPITPIRAFGHIHKKRGS